MTNFIEKFLSSNPVGKITKSFSQLQLGSNAGGLSNLLSTMNDLYGILSNRVQISSEILPALIHNEDIIPDLSTMDPVIDNNDPALFISNIDSSTAQVIESSFTEVVDFGKSVSSEFQGRQGITITDKTGHVYEMMRASGGEVSNVTAIIKTTINPSSKADLFLYRENGQYKCNTLLRSKGYWRPGHTEVVGSTIRDYLYACCDWFETADLGTNELAMTRSIANKLDVPWIPSQGINDILANIVSTLSLVTSDNTIVTRVHAIYQYAYDTQHSNDFGINKFYGDVLSDLMVSDTINNVLLSATDLIRNGRFTIESFESSTRDLVESASTSVKKVAAGITSSFASGGIYGACRFIITLIKQGTSLNYFDEDGVLQFTDNKNLVPTEYIAGMVTQIVGGIVTVVGLIVSIFSRIAGVALTILGSALMAIPKAINYDYNTATWATFTVADDDNNLTVLPYFPHGLFQHTMYKSDCNTILRNMFNDGITAFMLQVPGGIILVGPDTDDAKIRFEFHPAVCRYPYLRRLVSPAIEASLVESGMAGRYNIFITADMTWNHFNWTMDDIVDVMNTAEPLPLKVDGNGLVSNMEDDARLRLCFMQSLSLFYLFAATSDGRDITDRYVNGNGSYSPILIQFTDVEYGSAFINPYLQDHANLDALPSYMSKKSFNPLAYIILDDQVFSKICDKDLIEGTSMDARINLNLYYHVCDDGYGFVPSWSSLVTIAEQTNGTNSLYTYLPYRNFSSQVPSRSKCYIYMIPVISGNTILMTGNFINEVKDFPQNMTWCIQTPKYNRATFMMWVFIATLVTVAVTVATVIATVKLRKAIRTRQAINSARVEGAWSDFIENPTAENYTAYKRAVTKNNIFATITGGSKYSKQSYWAGDPSDSENDATSGIIEKAQSLTSTQANEDVTLMTAAATKGTSDVIYNDVVGLEGAIADQGAINIDTNTRLNSTQANVESALAEIFVIRRILKR